MERGTSYSHPPSTNTVYPSQPPQQTYYIPPPLPVQAPLQLLQQQAATIAQLAHTLGRVQRQLQNQPDEEKKGRSRRRSKSRSRSRGRRSRHSSSRSRSSSDTRKRRRRSRTPPRHSRASDHYLFVCMSKDLGWSDVLKAVRPYAEDRVGHIYISREDGPESPSKGYGLIYFHSIRERDACHRDKEAVWNRHKIVVRPVNTKRAPRDILERIR